MDSVYDFLRILHVFGFVFMSVPLFNLRERIQRYPEKEP